MKNTGNLYFFFFTFEYNVNYTAGTTEEFGC